MDVGNGKNGRLQVVTMFHGSPLGLAGNAIFGDALDALREGGGTWSRRASWAIVAPR